MPDLKPESRPPSQPSLERRRVISLDEQELRRLNDAYIAACAAADDDPTPENMERVQATYAAIEVFRREVRERVTARAVSRIMRKVMERIKDA